MILIGIGTKAAAAATAAAVVIVIIVVLVATATVIVSSHVCVIITGVHSVASAGVERSKTLIRDHRKAHSDRVPR